jgi:3-dehydroquinate synthase
MIKSFEINFRHKSSTFTVGDTFENVLKMFESENIIFITDSNIFELYQELFSGKKVIITKPGEHNKSLYTIREIYIKLAELVSDRKSFIIGVGGGVVCDLTGFASSTYLRGMKFGFIPSTLLAMVDAAIGGKNGVNFDSYKNQIGTINQPQFIFCDLQFLKTLDKNEITNAWAEVIKTAAINSRELFINIEKRTDNFNNLTDIIYRTAEIKSRIVELDEFESGNRILLNFGHTYGHAIESVIGIPHGQAVSLGICLALDLSIKHTNLKSDTAERIKSLLRTFNLPTEINIDKDILHQAILKDKKRANDIINFVLLEDIGKAVIKKLDIKSL